MKSIYSIFAAAIFSCIFTACSTDIEEFTAESHRTLTFIIYDASADLTRVSTDINMITTFASGDQAGLYAVRSGAIVEGFDNICLTMNASGFWEAPSSIEYTSSLDDVTFYAYFPYNAEATFEANAADPFGNMKATWTPAIDQSSTSKYNASDLMTTSGSRIGALNTVSLPLSHAMAMVCIELPNRSYIFNNEGMDAYVISNAQNASFKLGDTKVQPYLDDASQSYRLIVTPGSQAEYVASFESNGNNHSYKVKDLPELTAGQYAKYVIDGGASLTYHTLQVGDFYCADGSIVAADATVLPGNIIGVVYKLSTTEGIRNDYSNCTHALVISINEYKTKWGTEGSTTSEENKEGWNTWFSAYGLVSLGSSTPATDEATLMELGYDITKCWMNVPDEITLDGSASVKHFCDIMHSVVNQQRTNYAVPEIAVPWFTPSLRDHINMTAQIDRLNASLARIEGAAQYLPSSSNYYWSNQNGNQTSLWCWDGAGPAKRTSYKDSRMLRYIMAF